MPWWAAFLTGLTSGGLSCLAVQGGLLATALLPSDTGRQERQMTARVLVLFLSAKLVAYTALGFLLGAVGTLFQLTPQLRAVLLVGIGIFMLGNALRLLNVHPIFRYFALEPPARVRKLLRRTARQTGTTTPLLLGALTVLLPCGVTQAMMAVALGTGNALAAAMLMAAFTLGSNVVFFVLGYLTVQVGGLLERRLNVLMALAMLVVGVVSLDSGLTLAGSPVSLSRWLSLPTQSVTGVPAATPQAAPTTTAAAEVVITVVNRGYQPAVVHAPAEREVELTFVTNHVYSCARALVIPALHVEEILPDTGIVSFTIPAQPRGTVVDYSCSMGMYAGRILFDQ